MDCLSVIAVEIDFRLDPVTLTATDRFMSLTVWQIGDVGVTARAEILRVNRVRELLFIYKQRDCLTGAVGCDQFLVAVTGKAV